VTPSDHTARLQLLYDLGCAFAARIEVDELVPLVVAKCREVLDAEGVAVLLLDPSTGELSFPWVADEDAEAAARVLRLRFPVDRGIAGAVVRSGRSLRIDDVTADPRFYPEIDHQTGVTTRTLICAPLKTGEGTIGVIEVMNRRGGHPFGTDDLAFLEALAGSIAVAFENARLYARLKAAQERLEAQVGVLRRDLARQAHFGDMIGTGPAMREVFRLMESAAASPIAVLIEGDTGTGKELVARGIHRASVRAEGPFVAVNCAALPETLLESELFGHRRGAFTGATQDRQGLFEAATSGSILLDEVGDMPPPMQAKLLRVLQEGEVFRVGDSRPRRVDVRVLSATNRDLTAEVTARRFREDLYYRLNAFPIRLPALRERREDIPLLVTRSLESAAERHHKRIPGVAPDALACLVAFSWPGNVRELENEVERAVALARDGDPITIAHLSPKLHVGSVDAGAPATAPGPAPVPGARAAAPPTPLRRARAAFEAQYITEVLRQHGGNISRAAPALGLSRVMLQKKMKDYGLR
jgi:transcriptional regulator with GAF, ATPase, and Fis domain